MTSGPKPRIDDQFWFDYSADLVTKGSTSFDLAAGKIQTLVLWLWGIYTASTAIGFSLAAKDLALTGKVLIATTSVLLIAVYWATVWVQLPKSTQLDVRSPRQIRDIYANSIKIKEHRLLITKLLSVVAAAMVAISLLVASMGATSVSEGADFAVMLTPGKSVQNISVTTRLKNIQKVALSIDPVTNGTETNSTSLVLLPAPPDGLIQTCIGITNSATEFNVSMEWTNSVGTRTRISKKIAAPAH